MSRHNCTGDVDTCPRCSAARDRIEHERVFGDGTEGDE